MERTMEGMQDLQGRMTQLTKDKEEIQERRKEFEAGDRYIIEMSLDRIEDELVKIREIMAKSSQPPEGQKH